jgi:hypothetical protein
LNLTLRKDHAREENQRFRDFIVRTFEVLSSRHELVQAAFGSPNSSEDRPSTLPIWRPRDAGHVGILDEFLEDCHGNMA